MDTPRKLSIDEVGNLLGSPKYHKQAMRQLISFGSAAVPTLIRIATRRPTRVLTNGLVDYDGELARRLATEALGWIKDSTAVDALVSLLNDEDDVVIARAIWALGEIEEPRAREALIPMMGELQVIEKLRFAIRPSVSGTETYGADFRLGDLAADILAAKGKRALSDAFQQVLQGKKEGLDVLMESSERHEMITALIRALVTGPDVVAVHAANALGHLRALEALPALRSKAGFLSGLTTDPSVRQACASAISELQALHVLPRQADASSASPTLPRLTEDINVDSSTLPVQADHEDSVL